MLSHEQGPDGQWSPPQSGEPTIPELEADETIPPRPEEEVADVLRAAPDVDDAR